VLVTGGARGQGRSHAVEFAKEGADIVVTDIAKQVATVPYGMSSEADLAETVKQVEALDQRCLSFVADARDTSATNAAVEGAVAEFGKIDILLANHGLLSLSPVAEMSDSMWDDVISSDLTGVFKSIRAVLPHMLAQKSGRIIATASMAGRTGLPTVAHYCAAKWGVIGLIKSVAREVAAEGITVNCVCPTNLDSDMIHNPAFYGLFAPGIENPTREQVIPGFSSLNAIPIPWIEAIDTSNAMKFLASPEARYITGEALHVSAGWNAFNAA
jgi:SDR family mycofactocin-dependent oxidoreductase